MLYFACNHNFRDFSIVNYLNHNFKHHLFVPTTARGNQNWLSRVKKFCKRIKTLFKNILIIIIKAKRMFTLRVTHPKNQPLRPKTVTYRLLTHRHTDIHTQRKWKRRTPFFSIFSFSCFISFKRAFQKKRGHPSSRQTHRHTEKVNTEDFLKKSIHSLSFKRAIRKTPSCNKKRGKEGYMFYWTHPILVF